MVIRFAKLAWADGKLEDSGTMDMVYAERYGIEESYSTKVVDFLFNEAEIWCVKRTNDVGFLKIVKYGFIKSI